MKKQGRMFDCVICMIFGILMLVIGLLPLILASANVMPSVNDEDDWNTLSIFAVVFSIVGIVFLISYFVYLFRYLKTKKVIENGKKGICIIKDYDHFGGRYRKSYFMIVSYQGESGLKWESKLQCDFECLTKYPKGTKIECLIYGDDCYVDIHNIKVVKELDI